MSKYLYTLVVKESNIAIQDIAYSRAEARSAKSLYEGLYKMKVSMVRYERPTNIR